MKAVFIAFNQAYNDEIVDLLERRGQRGFTQWNDILGEEKMAEIVKQYKASKTVRRESPKIGRNDPCPCGSGKKYKHCCGRNV